MSAVQPPSTPVPDPGDKPVMGSMVARPLSELPPNLRPKRVEPSSTDNEYDVLHYMR